jgi:hypothetical protein
MRGRYDRSGAANVIWLTLNIELEKALGRRAPRRCRASGIVATRMASADDSDDEPVHHTRHSGGDAALIIAAAADPVDCSAT